MPKLYIRTHTADGRRTWKRVGHLTRDPHGLAQLFLQVLPGMVYHARITEEDLIEGRL